MEKTCSGGGGHLLTSLASRVFSAVLVFSIFFISSSFIFSSFIIPITIPNTYATESADKNTSTSTTDKGYSLSISVPKTVTIDLIPNPSGSFSYSELNTQVTTTNPTGYTLSFNASDSTGNTNANELINTNTNITTNNTIPSITNDTNQSNFPTNTWGYSINDGNNEVANLTFKPIPLPSSSSSIKTIKTTNTANTSGSNTKLILGIKADNSLASGTYTGQLTFTSVANYKPNFFPEISDSFKNMQHMTSAICSSVDTPTANATTIVTNKDQYTDPTTQVPQVTLTDSRDGNTYVVRKLADGNCWMVQNLRLGTLPNGNKITSNITLNSTNSDRISGTFTITPAQVQTSGDTNWGSTNDANTVNSVHVLDNGNAYLTGVVGDSTWNTSGVPNSATQYAGNAYNWYTATAGSGTYQNVMADGARPYSICPKNWQLPDTYSGYDKSFYKLLTDNNNGYGFSAGTLSLSEETRIRSDPISFVFSGGYYYPHRPTNALRGNNVFYYLNTATDTNNLVYGVGVRYDDNFSIASSLFKGYGSFVRCVAR